jgi:GDP-4-dehydro-6-deoxy-D-mannose reductase
MPGESREFQESGFMVSATSADKRPTLVTGVTGFAGCYLAKALLERNEMVVGLSRQAVWPAAWAPLGGRIDLRECDLGNGARLEAILREVRPARIYHLAGFAQVGGSFRDPEAAWSGNLNATRQLCEAVIRWGEHRRILFVGSGLIYGNREGPEMPYDEECSLRPDTPYAASKAAADLACYQYTCAPGLDIVRARPFNHIGPHQSAGFAIPDFARQLAAIGRGELPPILETGNLAAQRDLTDVRDTVAAYLLLMERGRRGEAYNIGTGQSHSMQTVLELLVRASGLKVEFRRRADLVRPTEQAVIRVDASKLRRETGWQPRHTLDRTLADTLAAWR